MLPHEKLYLLKQTAFKNMDKITEYLDFHILSTLDHPSRTMDLTAMLTFLKGILQIYLEFWNSTNPPIEYVPDIPDYTQVQVSIIQQCQHMISETLQLLSFVKSNSHFPNFSDIESVEKIDKLNCDLIYLLEDYFKKTIWTTESHSQSPPDNNLQSQQNANFLFKKPANPKKSSNGKNTQSSKSSTDTQSVPKQNEGNKKKWIPKLSKLYYSRLTSFPGIENARAYKCTVCPDQHFMSRRDKHNYLLRALQAVGILTRDISEYPCLNSASTTDHYTTTRIQYKVIKIFTSIYKITVCRLRVFEISPSRVNLYGTDGPLKHFQRQKLLDSLFSSISTNTQRLLETVLNCDVDEIWKDKYEQTFLIYNRLSKSLQKFVSVSHPNKCVKCVFD